MLLNIGDKRTTAVPGNKSSPCAQWSGCSSNPFSAVGGGVGVGVDGGVDVGGGGGVGVGDQWS